MEKNNKQLFIFLVLIFIISSIPVSLMTGPVTVSFSEIIEGVKENETSKSFFILRDIRLPRILLALLVGAALAVSGSVFQGLLVNPLADSYTTGVSSGAALGASIALILGLNGALLPIFSMIGAAVTLFLVMFISRMNGDLEPRNLILSGIIVGTVLSALISFIKTIAGDSLNSLVFWLMGSFSGRGWYEVKYAFVYISLAIGVILFYTRELDLLSFGSEQAASCGVNVNRSRAVLVVAASVCAATAVSVSGIIGFIGLVVPHSIRMIFGSAHHRVIPLSIVVGAALLLWADTFIRSFYMFGEIPVGVLTALLGGPFFCWLLVRRKM